MCLSSVRPKTVRFGKTVLQLLLTEFGNFCVRCLLKAEMNIWKSIMII